MTRKTVGRPAKLLRNLRVCALIDSGMLRREVASIEKVSIGRIAVIVRRFWKEYIKTKNG